MTEANVCNGVGCVARDPFPLHNACDHVRGTYVKLCSSCILETHASSFCCFCFELIADDHQKLDLIRCSKCASFTHIACITNPRIASLWLCPRCRGGSRSTRSFSYFSKGNAVTMRSARAFLAASKIALNGLRKREQVVKGEADQKVRESAVAWKRARDLLRSANVVCEEDEEEEEREYKRRSRSSREVEKWMRLHEPVSIHNIVEFKKGGSFSSSQCKVKNHQT